MVLERDPALPNSLPKTSLRIELPPSSLINGIDSDEAGFVVGFVAELDVVCVVLEDVVDEVESAELVELVDPVVVVDTAVADWLEVSTAVVDTVVSGSLKVSMIVVVTPVADWPEVWVDVGCATTTVVVVSVGGGGELRPTRPRTLPMMPVTKASPGSMSVTTLRIDWTRERTVSRS